MRTIAQVARVSPGRIIQQFGTKDKLLAEIFVRRRLEVSMTLKKELEGVTALADIGACLTRVLFTHEYQHLDLARHYYSYMWRWSLSEEAQFLEVLSQWVTMLSTQIARLCKRPVSADDLATAEGLLIIHAGSLRIAVMQGMQQSVAAEHAARLMAAVLRGVKV